MTLIGRNFSDRGGMLSFEENRRNERSKTSKPGSGGRGPVQIPALLRRGVIGHEEREGGAVEPLGEVRQACDPVRGPLRRPTPGLCRRRQRTAADGHFQGSQAGGLYTPVTSVQIHITISIPVGFRGATNG